MSRKVLIVEDQILLALEYEDMAASFGYQVVGLASTHEHVKKPAQYADIALVDLNLADGMSGEAIGSMLAQDFNIDVVFVTGSPEKLDAGVPGTIGVIAKPVSPQLLEATLQFTDLRRTSIGAAAPDGLLIFS